MSNQQQVEIPSIFGGLDSTSQYNGAPVDAAYLRAIALGGNRLAAKGHPAFRIFGNSTATGGGGDGGGTGPPPGNFSAYAAPFWQPFCRARLPVEKKPGLAAYDIRISCVVLVSTDEIWFQFETHAAPFVAEARPGAANLIQVIGTGSAQVVLGTGVGVPADLGLFDEVSIWVKGLLTARDQVAANGGTTLSGGVQTLGTQGPIGFMTASGSPVWNNTPPTWATSGSYLDLLSNGNVVYQGLQIIDVQSPTLGFIPPLNQAQIQQFGVQNASNMTYRIRQLPQVHVYDLVGHFFDRLV